MSLQEWIVFIRSQQHKLNAKEKLYLVGTGAILLIGTLFILAPQFTEISQSAYKRQQKRNEVTTLEKKHLLLAGLNSGQEAVSFDAFFTRAERYLPSKKPSLQVLVYLNRLARLQQVQMSGFSLNPGVVKSGVTNEPDSPQGSSVMRESESVGTKQSEYDSFEVRFSVSGKKDQVLGFIEKMARISPLMKIDEFSNSVPGDDQQKTIQKEMMNAQLTVKVYYQDLPKTIPSVTAPLATLTAQEEQFLEKLQDDLSLSEAFTNPNQVKNTEQLGKSNPFAAPQAQ